VADGVPSATPARGPLLVVGFGLAALADGIVLHQILQWHHLVVGYRSAGDLSGLQVNTLWDGVFHAASWSVVLGGVAWLVHAGVDLRAVGVRRALGWGLIGWGAFHVFDQLVFHLLLRAHHIRMVANYQIYDWGYTALGVLLAVVGVALSRTSGADRT
jgi:uncharacterized membrane protein